MTETTITIFAARCPYGRTSTWARDRMTAVCTTILRPNDLVLEAPDGSAFRVADFKDGCAILDKEK